MVNKENMRKFIAALRSGNYLQGYGKLEYSDVKDVVRNCCLGVACRVAMANGMELETTANVDGLVYSRGSVIGRLPVSFGLDKNALPYVVAEWLGIHQTDPPLGNQSATQINDSRDYDFNAIADMFEEQYLEDEEN
jgi:hypothetical protein